MTPESPPEAFGRAAAGRKRLTDLRIPTELQFLSGIWARRFPLPCSTVRSDRSLPLQICLSMFPNLVSSFFWDQMGESCFTFGRMENG